MVKHGRHGGLAWSGHTVRQLLHGLNVVTEVLRAAPEARGVRNLTSHLLLLYEGAPGLRLGQLLLLLGDGVRARRVGAYLTGRVAHGGLLLVREADLADRILILRKERLRRLI